MNPLKKMRKELAASISRPVLSVLSLCTGVGGDQAAFALADIPHETIAVAECDPVAAAALAHLFPAVPNLGDITSVQDWRRFHGKIDILTAGIPCQPHSLAGKRRGRHDQRDLTDAFCRIVAAVEPRCVLVENVEGYRTSEGGKAFRALARGLRRAGYDIADRVINAADVLPQRRRRLWILGYRRDAGRTPQRVLDLAARRLRGSEPGRALPLPAAAGPARGAAVHHPPRLGTLTASGSGLIKPGMKRAELDFLIVQEDPEVGLIVRRPTPKEAFRAQGFPDGWTDGVTVSGRPLTKSGLYRLAGNAWPVPVAARILREVYADLWPAATAA